MPEKPRRDLAAEFRRPERKRYLEHPREGEPLSKYVVELRRLVRLFEEGLRELYASQVLAERARSKEWLRPPPERQGAQGLPMKPTIRELLNYVRAGEDPEELAERVEAVLEVIDDPHQHDDALSMAQAVRRALERENS